MKDEEEEEDEGRDKEEEEEWIGEVEEAEVTFYTAPLSPNPTPNDLSKNGLSLKVSKNSSKGRPSPTNSCYVHQF